MSKIVCVVPTIRPECHAKFMAAWEPLFARHQVTTITVWDGDDPVAEVGAAPNEHRSLSWSQCEQMNGRRGLFCRRTDACRNLGFLLAAGLNPDYVLTLDDDCYPVPGTCAVDRHGELDPIQAHLDTLQRRVPLGWLNTAHDTDLFLRGVPYGIRDEAPVMLSHGVWVGTPDFDGETQLRLETGGETKDGTVTRYQGVPHSLPYFVGPVPRHVLFPLCGMNVMVRRDALPYLYYAPMGPDAGVDGLHRFGDIWMGVFLKRKFDELGWACYTGAATVLHSRASDAQRNLEQERLGRAWNERIALWALLTDRDGRDLPDDIPGSTLPPEQVRYFKSYAERRARYAALIKSAAGIS